jgi:RNA polymerase sigma-70 factor (ECF subfamily)
MNRTILSPVRAFPTQSSGSDEELLLRFRDEHDQDAFAELIRRYERPLKAYLSRYLGNSSQADEVCQTTFERLFERGKQFGAGRRFKPWLYSIATHLAIDALRHARRHHLLEFDAAIDRDDSTAGTGFDLLSDDSPGPAAQLEAAESSDWVRGAVASLPDDWRAVIRLVYFQGMTLREAAEALGQPLGTIKSRLHRALLRLNTDWKAGHRVDAA